MSCSGRSRHRPQPTRKARSHDTGPPPQRLREPPCVPPDRDGRAGGSHRGGPSLANGLPEGVVAGREQAWVGGFIDSLEVRKGAATPEDVAVFAGALKDPAHLAASFKWFRPFPQDIEDNAVSKQTKLAMPVLAIGAAGSLGTFVPDQVRQYATDVTGVVVPGSGHWIYEERPAELTGILLDFLGHRP